MPLHPTSRSRKLQSDIARKLKLLRRRNSTLERLEDRRLLIGSDWSNGLTPLNVTNDAEGLISPVDVLQVINELNGRFISDPNTGSLPPLSPSSSAPPPFVDVNCDKIVSPIDALLVINHLNGSVVEVGPAFSTSSGQSGRFSPLGCGAILRESTSLITTLHSQLVIPSDAASLTFELDGLEFDTASQASIKDAFEVALLDVQGRSLVSSIGTGRDAYYNHSEQLAELATTQTIVSGQRITLSLLGILPGTTADLVFRLVNNDSDTQTAVAIRSVEFSSQFPSGEGLNRNLPNNRVGAAGATVVPESTLPVNAFPGIDAVLTSKVQPSANAIQGRLPTASAPSLLPASASGLQANSEGSASTIDSRGTEFWIGFLDNLFEGNNRPQKVLYITGEVATTGTVDIPGLVDAATSLPFHVAFVVNPGEVTAVELPSLDVGDGSDIDTDFDVEVELIARVQRKGIHVVTQDPVTVYGLNLAVSTSDAFLALPVTALGNEYINLGYENTFASISHVEGTQFLVVATEDDTHVTLAPGQYSGATKDSNASIKRPNGTSEFNLGNTNDLDIGPFVTDSAGTGSLVVSPPYDGYSGTYNFELIDVATAAVSANFDEQITANFPTGRESKVYAFDVAAGQLLYYDAIHPSPAPSVNVRIMSSSGDLANLASQSDNNSFVNLFGALLFRETGKYYVLITGEHTAAFDFNFRLVNMEVATKIVYGESYQAAYDPSGPAEIYRVDGIAGQSVFFDALTQDRNVGFTVLGPGGQQVFNTTASDDRAFVWPETGTYMVVLDSASFRTSEFGFRLLDLTSAPALPLGTDTTLNIASGQQSTFNFTGAAAQTFQLDVASVTPFFRATYQLLDSSGNIVPLNRTGNRLTAKLMFGGTYSLLIGALTVQEGGSITLTPSLITDPLVTKSGMNSVQTVTITAGGNGTYTFNAPAGTRVLVDGLNLSTSNLYVELQAPDGTRLFTGFGFANDQQDIPRIGPAFLPQSGTYTLTVRGNNPTDAGSYLFRVIDLDSFGTPMAFDTLISGNFATTRESTLYTFDASAGDKLLFDGRSGGFIFGIYDEALNPIYSRGSFGAANVNEVDGLGRVLRSGRHYVLFQGDPSIPLDFSFQIQNLSLAPSLAIGQEAVGTVPAHGQVHYRLQLVAGQRIRLDNVLPFATEVNYRIANSGGRVLFDGGFQNSDSSPPGNRLIVVPESGEYFMSIVSRQATPGDFRFRIDDLALAPLLTFDANLEVILNPGNAAQVFRIDATAGETIQLDNLDNIPAGQQLDWEISGPTTQFRGGSNDGRDFTATILSAGTHFFTISGRQNSGPLTIRFRATRTPAPVVPLTGFNTPVSLDVGINETKTYSFSAPTGRLVYLNVLQSQFAIPSHTVTLNQGETYLLRDLAGSNFSGSPDLSGSIITSTKPIAVFGGNRATFVPSQFFAADHLVEQLPPTNTWGREFVTMPLNTGSSRGELFRFLAQADNTRVTVDGLEVATLDRGEFHQQILTGPAHITSSNPILVAQYAHSQNYYRTDPGGNAAFLGDPLMMIVPPAEQFLASYTVSTPAITSNLSAQRFDRNFINILAPNEAVGQIQVDGVPIPADRFTDIGISGFSGAQHPISLGAYDLAGPLPFGVFVYGFGSFDSYGYVGGQSLAPVASAASVVLTPAAAKPLLNETLNFTARVSDSNGAPLSGIRVDFDVAGVHPQRGFGFSDQNGVVAFSYIGTSSGRDVVTASVGQLLDDTLVDWGGQADPPQLTILSPSNASVVPAGTELVATGFGLADFPNATIDLITVNGVPVETVDGGGNFFARLFVGPGENEFEFQLLDSSGQLATQTITLTGQQLAPNTVDFDQFADVSASFALDYSRTSYNQATKTLFAETFVENVGQFPTDVPLLVAIANISDPMILVRDPDGQTPDGLPYYDFSGLVSDGSLNPGSQTGLLSASFFNPNQAQFTYDLIFFGKLNQPPQITSLPVTQVDFAQTYSYDVLAIDPNQEPLTYSLLESPAGMTINSSTGAIRWTPTASDAGEHTVEVEVSDPRLGVARQRFSLLARAASSNRAPVFTSLPASLAEVGRAYPYVATAVDADGDSLTYTLIASPVGMSIAANTGTVAWTPTATQLGQHDVVLAASDGRGGGARQAFSVLVVSPADNLAPVIVNQPPAATNLAGLSHQIIALDADQEPLTYRLVQSPIGMQLSSSGLLTWTPSIADLGSHEVQFEALDPHGGRDSQQFTLAVFDNQPPVLISTPVTQATVGTDYVYQLLAQDDIDDMLSYKLLDAPAGMTVVTHTGLIHWPVLSTAQAQELVTVAVLDGRGGIGTQQFTIAVANGQTSQLNRNPSFSNSPPTVANVGTKFHMTAQARDPDGDPIIFDLPLGPAGMVIDAATGQLGWLPRPDQGGKQQVVIRAADGQGGIWLQSFQIDVDLLNVAPVVTSQPWLSGGVGQVWEYRVHVQDADGDPLQFELLAAPAGMQITSLQSADAQAVIQFTPANVGAFAAQFRVSDGRGGVAMQSFTLQVSPTAVNVPPTIDSTPRTVVPLGEPWVYSIAADDVNGDPLSLQLLQAPNGLQIDPQQRLLSWAPTASQLGIHDIVLQVSDGRGGTTQQDFSVEVIAENTSTAPRIVSPPSAFRATLGEMFSYDLRAADDDGDAVEWLLLDAPHGTSLDARYGTLRWTPTLEQLGQQSFLIAARDPAGNVGLQSFSLVVSGANLGPTILSRAPSEATVDERYVYALRAVDPENNPLVFSLKSSPSGMTIDTERGVIRWTPTAAQIGTAQVSVEVRDAHGHTAEQTFGVAVAQAIRNQPPTIFSRPTFRTRATAQYEYQVQARDVEGDALSYQILQAPAGMQINASSGHILWTPTLDQVGSHLIRVVVTDTAGNQALQRFAIQVRANQAPVIVSIAPTEIALGGKYGYDVQVDDAESDPLEFELLVAPAGMTIDALGAIEWMTEPGVAEVNSVVVQVTDAFGATVLQSFTLNVTPDTSAPVLELQFSANPLVLGGTAIVFVQASDDVGIVELTLTRDGVPLVLDTNRTARLDGQQAGLIALQATARDASGNVGQRQAVLRVFDPADTLGPVINLTSPQPGAVVTTLTDIVGSINDDNLQFYRIDYGRADLVDVNQPAADDPDYRTLMEGNANAVDAVLATFDPTILINDDYVIRLLAQDLSGNVSAKTLPVSLDGQLKLGQFAFDLVDLTIPVAGMPITVTRSYDTRNANESGDFGFGWNLSVADPQIRESLPVNPLEEEGLFFAATPFREGTRVYLTNPEGRRVGFTFRPQRQFSIFGGGSFSARFVPDPGVQDRLDVGQPQLRKVGDGFYNGFFGDPFNPSAYRLTTKNGVVYEYGQFGGLDNITDRNGNRIEIRPDGVFSSIGSSIQFVRDPQGRISQIIDPAGSTLRYEYDLNGDLKAFTDQVGQRTRYEYTSGDARLLDTVINSAGVTTLAANYDSEGRLQASTNASGGTIQNSFDPINLRETSTDPLGNVTTVQFDERGNILRADQPGGGVVQFSYDDRDNLVRAVDEAGHSVLREFDAQNNLVRTTDPLGNVYSSKFNDLGQLTEVIDPLDRAAQFVYSTEGDLLSVVNALGQRTSATFDDQGRVTETLDANGNATEFVYSGGSARASAIIFPATTPVGSGEAEEPVRATRSYEYNDLGQVIRETDENGNSTHNFYDALGRPLRTVDATGATYSYVWQDDLLVSATDPLGRVTRYEYDALGRRVRTIDPVGGVTELTYDSRNQVTQLKDPLGRVTTYTYTVDGRLEQQRDPLGNSTRFEYDALGNRTAVVDALGHRFVSQFDALGRITSTIDPLGGVTQFEYDSVGNQYRVIDALGNATEFRYDSLNRLTAIVDTLGSVTSRDFDANGNIARVVDAKGNASRFDYDARDRLVRATDPAGFTRQQAWDAVGNRVSFTNELGETTFFQYDLGNRGIGTVSPTGATTTRTVDAFGNTVQFRDELGNVTSYAFNGLNQVAVIASSDGLATRYGYDAAGNRTLVVDPLGNITQYEYDALNRLVRETNPLGDAMQFSFDAVGNLVAQTDRNRREIRYQYDAARQLKQELWLDTDNASAIVHSIGISRDALGNILRLTEPGGELRFEYDAIGRVVQQDTPLAATAGRLVQQFEYDPVSLPTRIIDSLGGTLSRSYDNRNLLSSTTLVAPSLNAMQATFLHDARGATTSIARFSGGDLSTPAITTVKENDRLGRLQSITHTDRNQATLDRISYEYDDLFRVTSETDSLNSSSNQYDTRSQLIARENTVRVDEAFEYDAGGNRVGSEYTNGANNLLLSDARFDYDYDRQGNLTLKTERASGLVTSYEYDHRQRLTSVEIRDAQGALQNSTNFGYDPLNRRISVTGGSQDFYTAYAGETVWADYDADGNLLTQYLPGENIDELLGRNRPGSDGVSWYLADRLGSTRALVDQDGRVLSRIAYDSFGNILSESDPAVGDRFTFTGRELNREIGLLYYRARYYDPLVGDFISEDPLGFEGGDTNLRRYVGNNPVNAVDPLGLQAIADSGALFNFVSVYGSFALTWGADVPFTYRIACEPGRCGISGSVDGSSVGVGNIPVPYTGGAVTVGATVTTDNRGNTQFNPSVGFNPLIPFRSAGSTARPLSAGIATNGTAGIGPNGPAPSFTNSKASLSDNPTVPRESDFDFMVVSTAKSPHLVISANLAIYVGVGQELELIAAVAAAEDWQTSVEVEYNRTLDNPSAAVRARGFASLPIRPLATVPNPNGPPANPGKRSTTTPPPPPPAPGPPADSNNGVGTDPNYSGPNNQAGGGTSAAIGDFVWYDNNGDGLQSVGEGGVANVAVRLFTPGADGQIGGADDALIGLVLTDALGFYIFKNLAPGTYFVVFDQTTLPAGFIPTLRFVGSPTLDSNADRFGVCTVITLAAGQVDLTQDMGIVRS